MLYTHTNIKPWTWKHLLLGLWDKVKGFHHILQQRLWDEAIIWREREREGEKERKRERGINNRERLMHWQTLERTSNTGFSWKTGKAFTYTHMAEALYTSWALGNKLIRHNLKKKNKNHAHTRSHTLPFLSDLHSLAVMIALPERRSFKTLTCVFSWNTICVYPGTYSYVSFKHRHVSLCGLLYGYIHKPLACCEEDLLTSARFVRSSSNSISPFQCQMFRVTIVSEQRGCTHTLHRDNDKQ